MWKALVVWVDSWGVCSATIIVHALVYLYKNHIYASYYGVLKPYNSYYT